MSIDAARIKALHMSSLLDRAGSEQFNRIVGMARDILDAPVALVSLIDQDRQVFIGHVGLPEPWSGMGETPLTHSFCRHVVADNAALIVPNAPIHPVVAGNAAIADLNVIAYLGTPLALPTGEVIGALAVIDGKPREWTPRDLRQLEAIAEIVEAEMIVRSSELKWRTVFEHMQEGFFIGKAIRDAAGRLVDFSMQDANPALMAKMDVNGVGHAGSEALLATLGDVLRDGTPAVLETQGFGDGWQEARVRRLDHDRFAVILADITARKASEVAAAQQEKRRRLATEVGEVGIWDMDVIGNIVEMDVRMCRMNGVFGDTGMTLEMATAAIHPEDLPALSAAMAPLINGQADSMQITYRVIGIEDGETRHVQLHGIPIRDSAGTCLRLVGAARDITSRVQHERHRDMISRELSHRLKNSFALVQAIINQTLRKVQDPAVARQLLLSRIRALADAQDILLGNGVSGDGLLNNGHGADIAALIRVAVGVHDADGTRIRISGPKIPVGSRAGLNLTLILHELATNAVKYGALSVDSGHVDLRWSVGTDDVLTLDWTERGGPPASTPVQTGFGTRLIRMGVTESERSGSEVTYAPEGLRCRLYSDLTEFQRKD